MYEVCHSGRPEMRRVDIDGDVVGDVVREGVCTSDFTKQLLKINLATIEKSTIETSTIDNWKYF